MSRMPLAHKQDSSQFSEGGDDPTMRAKTEGGYEVTRPRYTRRPRRVFQTTIVNISEAQRLEYEAFWNKHTGSLAFEYEHPTSKEVISVRFVQRPRFSYAGMGGNHRWNITGIELKEV